MFVKAHKHSSTHALVVVVVVFGGGSGACWWKQAMHARRHM
jgi:hypothetical protein